MKKKLVAFAVTAAMLVTSAVPALAWTATGLDTSANEVVVTAESGANGVTDTNVAGSIQNGKEFKTWIDFNRTNVNTEYVLNLDGPGVEGMVKLQITKNGDDCTFVARSAGKEVEVDAVAKGIVELTWRFFAEDNGKWLDISIDDLGSTANVEYLQDIQLRAGVENVVSLELQKLNNGTLTDDNQIVFYQNQAPEDVVSAEIVECTGVEGSWYTPKTYHGNPVVATQPVEGGYYRVNAVTLDDGTVIGYDDLEKYFDIVWKATKANGTTVPTTTNFTTPGGDWEKPFWMLDNSNGEYDGCTITCEITPKDGTGLFNKVIVWEDSEAIAVQSRLAGEDRFATAMEVADQMKPAGGFQTIFIATGTNYADALSATALAAQMEAPILLVNAAHEADVINYINENSAGYANTTIYVIGGTNAVSQSFQDSLYKYAVNVERLAGDTRYDTNIEILEAYLETKTVYGDSVTGDLSEILVASGTNYPDALSAAATDKPVLLVGDELTKAQRVYLQGLKTVKVSANGPKYVIVGGTVAVSADLMAELSEKAYVASESQVSRIYGDDRYETNKMVMDKYMTAAYDNATGAKHVYVACGTDFADALTGGVIAAVNDSPLVLVSPNKTNYAADVVAKVADNNGYGGLIVVGGENAVSSATVQKIA